MSNFYQARVGQEIFHIHDKYVNLEKIGDGAYGLVCSAHNNLTNTPVAIKKIHNLFQYLEDSKRVVREIKLLRHFRGRAGVVELIDIMTYPPNTVDFEEVYLVTPLYESDLEKILASDQELSDAHAQYFMYQLLKALKYVHSANVIHRDLKPPNLLVNSNCDLALCDFGLARPLDEDQMTEYVVTRWYRAPELLLQCPHYDTGIDVWSAGCVLAELLGRRPLFPGRNYIDQLDHILKVLGNIPFLHLYMFLFVLFY